MKYEPVKLFDESEYSYSMAFGFRPDVVPYIHENDTVRPCVLVVPGGGYAMVAPSEGELVADRFYEAGYQTFVLTYSTNLFCAEPLRELPLRELAQALRDMARMREHWFEVFEDLEKEHKKELEQARKETREMEKRALKAQGQRDEALSKVTEQRREIYRMGAELEEEKGKNKKLTAQLNRDYENSSIPSSLSKKRKKVSNSREKTGRKPGGQPGHKGQAYGTENGAGCDPGPRPGKRSGSCQ